MFQTQTNCGAAICRRSPYLERVSDLGWIRKGKWCRVLKSFTVCIVAELRKLEFHVVSDLNDLSTVCIGKYIYMYPWDCYAEHIIILFTFWDWCEWNQYQLLCFSLLKASEMLTNLILLVSNRSQSPYIHIIWPSRTFFKELAGLACQFFSSLEEIKSN